MKLQIKVSDEGVIEDAKFKTFGCGSAIASSSLVTEWVKGKTVDEAVTIKNTEIAEELNLPPVKIHCSVLAEDAIKAAVEDYKKKHDCFPREEKQRLPEGPSFMAITLTPNAASHVQRASQARQGARPARRRAHLGCSGLAYKLEFADQVNPGASSSRATASRWSSIRRACSSSTALSSTTPARA